MILDLYAGAGGWDEGARILGLPSVGLELWHDACVTAVRAGHARIRCDVAKYPTCRFVGLVRGLIGSPPCTVFSSAGNGAGRQVIAILRRGLDELAAGKATRAARRKECQRVIAAWALTKRPKMRRAERAEWAWGQAGSAVQVLEPLRYARDIRPEWVALEQVEAVLPIWRHIAHVLRGWGYTVWVGVLNSADYGVPQTRRRAVLIASRVGQVSKPEPTHEQNPPEDVLFGARLPWVSMAQALGWADDIAAVSNYGTGGDTAKRGVRTSGQPAATVTSKVDRVKLVSCRDSPKWVAEHGERRNREGGEPAPTTTGEAHRWSLRSGQSVAGEGRAERRVDEPAVMITGRADLCSRVDADRQQEALRLTVADAGVLQSFPADYPWFGKRTSQFLQVGNAVPPRLAAAVISAAAGVDWRAALAEHDESGRNVAVAA